MTARTAAPDRTWDPVRFHRGTRGFAAFVTIINGLAMLAVGLLVAPRSDLGSPLVAWLTIVGISAGLAHFVAVYGLIRGRRWSGSLVAYLAAGGIGASVFAILMIARAGEPIFGASDASAVGFFIWMIGSWLVATRFALKPFRTSVPSPRVDPPSSAVVVAPPAPRAVVSLRPAAMAA